MAGRSKRTGCNLSHSLCKSCRHTRVCACKHKTPTPIFECAEYDDDEPRLVTTVVATVTARRPTIRAAAMDAIKGLCRTCENNQTCTYSWPASGIWRCEEYR